MLTMTDAVLLEKNEPLPERLLKDDIVKVLRDLQYYTVRGMVQKYFEVLGAQDKSVQGFFATATLFFDGKQTYPAPAVFLGFSQHPKLLQAFSNSDQQMIQEMFKLPVPIQPMPQDLQLLLMQQVLCETTRRAEVQENLLVVLKEQAKSPKVNGVREKETMPASASDEALELKAQLKAANSRANKLESEVNALKARRPLAIRPGEPYFSIERISYVDFCEKNKALVESTKLSFVALIQLQRQVLSLDLESFCTFVQSYPESILSIFRVPLFTNGLCAYDVFNDGFGENQFFKLVASFGISAEVIKALKQVSILQLRDSSISEALLSLRLQDFQVAIKQIASLQQRDSDVAESCAVQGAELRDLKKEVRRLLEAQKGEGDSIGVRAFPFPSPSGLVFQFGAPTTETARNARTVVNALTQYTSPQGELGVSSAVLQTRAEDVLRTEIDTLKAQIAILKDEQTRSAQEFKSTLIAAEKISEDLKKRLERNGIARASQEESITNLTLAKEKVWQECEALRREVAKQASIIQASREAHQCLETKVATLEAEKEDLAGETHRLSAQVADAQGRVQESEKACLGLAEQVADLRILLTTKKNTSAEQLKSHADIRARLQKSCAQQLLTNSALERKNAQLSEKNNELEGQVREQALALDDLSQQGLQSSEEVLALRAECEELSKTVQALARELLVEWAGKDAVYVPSKSQSSSGSASFFSVQTELPEELDPEKLWMSWT